MFRATIEQLIKLGVLLIPMVSMGYSFAEEPQWIWGNASANESAEDGLVLFKKDFKLNKEPKSAVLRITCDDQYVVRVNGRIVGVNERWQDVERYEISSVLQAGDNAIFVRSRNLSKGPAGLMFDLEVVDEDDGKVSVVSDDTWEASTQKSGTWNPDVAKIKKWKSAVVLGKFSSTLPWKDQLAEAESVRTVGRSTRSRDQFELLDGDRVLLLGNTVIEREQRYGYWEAALTTQYPDRNIIFRNLGWSGDTVLGEARARFGTQAEGFAHLEVHVHAVNPTVIICGYGSNAAFAGPDGLEAFVANYNDLLDTLEATGAAIVLMAPLRHEPFQGRYLSPDYNTNRDLYAKAIERLAKERSCLFFELPQDGTQRLTDNGVHLNEEGYARSASSLIEALGLSSSNPEIKVDVDKRSLEWNKNKSLELDPRSATIGKRLVRFRITRKHVALPSASSVNAGKLFIKGLEDGDYTLTVDGESLPQSETAEGLAAGIPLPSSQRATKLLHAIRKKNELYFHRWRPQNETYLFLFRKHEQGNNAVEIPQFDPLVEDVEKEIDRWKRPLPIEVSIRKK